MNKVQQIQKAKSYIDMLSHMIDPTTQTAIEESVLSKKEIRDTFEFISILLEQLIDNNGEIIQVSEQLAFSPKVINKELVNITEEPVSILGLIGRINKQVNTKVMKRLGYAKINGWLIDNGYLTTESVSVVKQENRLKLTDTSQQIGIVCGQKVNKSTGEIQDTVLFNSDAQNFILDNLETILSEE